MAGAANPSVQYLLSPSYAFLDPGYASLLLSTHIFLGLDVFLAQETTFNAPQGPSENWQCVPEWEREVGAGGVCCSSTVFVRSLRVHLYGVGTHSLSLSQPLTTAICNAVMWSTVSLCPLPTQTHARATSQSHKQACIRKHNYGPHTPTWCHRSHDNKWTHISKMQGSNCGSTCFSWNRCLRVLFRSAVKQLSRVLKYNCGGHKRFEPKPKTLQQSWFLMFLICSNMLSEWQRQASNRPRKTHQRQGHVEIQSF